MHHYPDHGVAPAHLRHTMLAFARLRRTMLAFARLRHDLGHSAGTFDFGGVPVSLASANRRFRHLCHQRYGAFATDAAPAWRAVYQVRDARTPCPHFLHDARRHPMRSRRDGSRLRLASETFTMELDACRRSVELAGPLATYPLDRLIQTLWYESHCHGLMIHAAALAEGDRGWIFSGPSGAGKSTLASLFPEHALCDEFVALSLDGAAPRLGSLPFWTSRRGSAELAGIHLLRHGRRDHRRRLGAGEAFARLRREVVWPTFDPDALSRAFASLCQLVEAVPVWELAFRPGREVWKVIQGESAGEAYGLKPPRSWPAAKHV